jgi:glycosyltransferase involved in cell wall biosynthesis
LIGYLSYTVSSFVTGFFQKNVDLIIVTSPPLFVGVSAWFLAKIKRVPFIFEVRDLWPESAIATGVLTNNILINVMYWIEKSLYKNAHKIIALTPAFKEDISKRFPEYAPKIEIITNGADLDLMAPGPKNNWVRDQYNWQNKKVFSYFGAHGVANNLIQVINVAEKFRDRDDILFVLIGDGMQKDELKETARKLNLKNIQFIDSVPKQKVQDFINASDVCMAILKKTDTFKTVYPNKVFDYMACKKPIIVTIDGITRKLIEDAQAGLFAEPENAESFKETVEKFIELDDAELEKLGQNGYNYVRKYFDRSKLAEKYLKIIENTI